ncbi:hypothetical protein BS78_04G069800 [Paspalum vaginatum]|nr:hypothetical protein BS78_04G069800 [Paspalum vaginatum]
MAGMPPPGLLPALGAGLPPPAPHPGEAGWGRRCPAPPAAATSRWAAPWSARPATGASTFHPSWVAASGRSGVGRLGRDLSPEAVQDVEARATDKTPREPLQRGATDVDRLTRELVRTQEALAKFADAERLTSRLRSSGGG